MPAAGEGEGEGGELSPRSVLDKPRRTKETRLAALAEKAALDQECGLR